MKTSSPTPRLGCTAAYVFAYRSARMTIDDYMDAIVSVSRLGFAALDLEILEDSHIGIYTSTRIRMLREQAARHHVSLCGFTPWNTQKYLYSLDPARRRIGLRLFADECRITRDLGIPEVHLGSDIPPELVKSRRTEYKSAPPSGIRLQKAAWDQVWRLTVDTYKKTNQIALKYGLRFGIEPRANSVIWSADSFLRLREAVGPNCGCVWDPMHAAYHREDSALALRKLGSSLLSLQLCDADGDSMFHRKLGSGTVDLPAIKQALKAIRYRGSVLLELYYSGRETKPTVDRYYRASKTYWENL